MASYTNEKVQGDSRVASTELAAVGEEFTSEAEYKAALRRVWMRVVPVRLFSVLATPVSNLSSTLHSYT